MSGMLRTDGKWEIYVLQHRYKHEGEWMLTGLDGLLANVPKTVRWVNPHGHDGKQHEPFQAFSASGACWQKLGIHGTFNYATGQKMLNLIAKYNPAHTYRLACYRVRQFRIAAFTPTPLED